MIYNIISPRVWYSEVPLAIQLHPQKTPTNILCLPDSLIPFPFPTLQNPRIQMFFPHKFQLWHVWIVYSLLPKKLRYSPEKLLVEKTMFSFEKSIPFQVKNLQFSRVGSTATVSSRCFFEAPKPLQGHHYQPLLSISLASDSTSVPLEIVKGPKDFCWDVLGKYVFLSFGLSPLPSKNRTWKHATKTWPVTMTEKGDNPSYPIWFTGSLFESQRVHDAFQEQDIYNMNNNLCWNYPLEMK